MNSIKTQDFKKKESTIKEKTSASLLKDSQSSAPLPP